MADTVRPGPPVREQVVLAGYTTLRLGGPARRLAEAASEAEIVAEVQAADQRGEPLLVLGGGSNLVVADEGFPGTVVHVTASGVRHRTAGPGAGPAGRGPVELTVAAGEDWDAVVAGCVGEGLAGLECLSGIPGRAGATPIQNVGAYGHEVAEVITTVRVFDRLSRQIGIIPNERCRFSYRTSMFRRGEPGRFVVLAVTFRLAREPLSMPVRYAELAAELDVEMGARAGVGEVRSGVLKIRARKGMLLNPGDPDSRSAGSFFTNPVLDAGQFAQVESAAASAPGAPGPVPRFDAGDGLVKVPAAWLIEHAGFGKGYGAPGPARVSSKHTLALINT